MQSTKDINQKCISLILGGGEGSRLYPLTKERSKPAVPIGGKYRLIDVPISNCLNSGLRRIYVLTQYNSASLNKHIKNTFNFDRFSSAFVDILAAEQTKGNYNWFQGTADAVRQSLRNIRNDDAEYISSYFLAINYTIWTLKNSSVAILHIKRMYPLRLSLAMPNKHQHLE